MLFVGKLAGSRFSPIVRVMVKAEDGREWSLVCAQVLEHVRSLEAIYASGQQLNCI